VTGLLAFTLASAASALQGVDALPAARKYLLTDTYYARSQAKVYVRESTTKAEYHLDVAERKRTADGKRVLEAQVTRVVVDLDVPAQKRKGSIDSAQSDNFEAPFKNWELVRPASFFDRKLSFVMAEGRAEKVDGADAVAQKFAEMFDRDFRGTEAADHVRALELEAARPENIRGAWGALLAPELSLLRNAAQPSVDVQIDACIPSESWKTRLRFPCKLTVEEQLVEGQPTIRRSGKFVTDNTVATTIGPCEWSYQVKSGEYAESYTFAADGHLARSQRLVEAELNSTLSLDGKVIPVRMNLRHEFELRSAAN
jgi:hypothetical protein